MKKPLLNILLLLLQTPAPSSQLPTFLSNQYPLLHALQSLSLPKHIVLFPSDTTIIMMNMMFNPHHSTSLTVCTAHHKSRLAIVQSLNPPPPHPLPLHHQNLRSNNIKQIHVVHSYSLSQGREEEMVT